MLLDLYSRALVGRNRPLGISESAEVQVEAGAVALRLTVRRAPGSGTVISSPAGRLELLDLTLDVQELAEAPQHRVAG